MHRCIMNVEDQEAETVFQEAGGFEVGSTVQVGQPPRYGVVRWLGSFPKGKELLAGIELEEWLDNCGEGMFENVHYFSCRFGHAFFCPLKDIQSDQRFMTTNHDPSVTHGNNTQTPVENPLQTPLEESEDQIAIPPTEFYIGERKGIQGHYNSCYLDSTLFALFALSNVFDAMFLGVEQDATPTQREFSYLVAKKIVNPLRKHGAVRHESVMELRQKIEEVGKMEGVQEKEKDPEELLNVLFKKILKAQPFIQIRRSFGTEDEFFVQLFVSFDQALRLPTMQELMRRMFAEGELSLTKAPSQLIIQVPRYGRAFKTCQRIIPDLKFDISEFTESYLRAEVPNCVLCGEKSSWKCRECTSVFVTSDDEVYLCDLCSKRAHNKRGHPLDRAVAVPVAELDLLSVICIETSHYVCFTRDLNSNTWLFFDSMADRIHNTFNIPQVTDCTAVLNEWVYGGDLTQLLSAQPRELPGLVRRFTQDVYMCVYVQRDYDNSQHCKDNDHV